MMRKSRVVIIHYTAFPIIGGVESVIEQHMRLLSHAGYPVTLVVGRGGSGEALGAEVMVIPELDSEYSGNIDVADSLARGIVPLDFYSLQTRIADLLEPVCANADVVIVHNILNFHFNLPLTAALYRLLDRQIVRRMIAWCHDISRYVNPASGENLRNGFPWDLLRTFRQDAHYVAVSHHRQQALARILGCESDYVQVIPNGVDLPSLLRLSDVGRHLVDEFALVEGNPIMLMPVRITRAKNIEFALRVTESLKSRGLQPRLIVTGPPDPHSPNIVTYVEELLTIRQHLGLCEEVDFVYEGTSAMPKPLIISTDIVAELYQVTDLVLLPSHREGFGLPILEAGLVGKPIFCTPMPALEEVGKELVHCIEPGETPEQIATRMVEWMQTDNPFRLRCRIRQYLRWSTIFAQSIEPLIVGQGVAQEQSG